MGQGCRLGGQHRGPPCGLQPYCPPDLSAWPAGLLPRRPRAAARAEINTRSCHQHVPPGRNDTGLWGPAQLQGHPCSVTRRLLRLASVFLPVGSSPHRQFWALCTLTGLWTWSDPRPRWHLCPIPSHIFLNGPFLFFSFFLFLIFKIFLKHIIIF